MKRAILHQTHYVELLLVVDNNKVRKQVVLKLWYALL